MVDPIKPVIERIKQNNRVKKIWQKRHWQQDPFTNSFLSKVGEAFERYDYETTRLYLNDKKQRDSTSFEAEVLLEVLEYLNQCPAIRQRRCIGRTIIKSLNTVIPDQY